MNWIDWVILGLIGFAAVSGFLKGFIRELCALIGLVLGVWAGIHLNRSVAVWLGLDPKHEALAFLLTLLLVVVLLHLIGMALTKVIDAAQLGLLNKVLGAALGALRKAFMLSVILNVLMVQHDRGWAPSLSVLQGSALFGPLRAFAPAVVPALGETKWLKRALEDVRSSVEEVGDDR